MLHIRQPIYLVLKNVLSASILIVHITTFDEISLQFQSTNISMLHMYRTNLSLPQLYRPCCADLNQHNIVCTILVRIDVLNTCGAMICSYFGVVFVLLLKKIENAVYTCFQNSMLLFINHWSRQRRGQGGLGLPTFLLSKDSFYIIVKENIIIDNF